MYNWFQNLNENKNKLFHFRGSFGSSYNKQWFTYEVCSGFELRFKVTICPYKQIGLQIAPLFCSLYLNFPFFSFAKWIEEKKTTGFYVFQWALVWSFMENEWDNPSRRPWWKHFYFRIDDFILGKPESLKDELVSADDVFFELGNTKFKMDSIQWIRYRRFRRHIPYTLFHRTNYCVDMKIDKPPMRAGKGENSWDCDDDGSFGIHGPWKHQIPTYLNREECIRLAIDYYVDSVMRDAKKYGGGSGDRGINKTSEYKYIGRIIPENVGSNEAAP